MTPALLAPRLRHAAALALALALSACDEAYFKTPVDVPDEPPRLVAVGLFQPGVPWAVQVGRSTSLRGRSSPTTVADAVVEVYDGATLVERLAYQPASDDEFYSSTRYVGTTAPVEGRTYTLRVRAPSLADTEGSSRAPAPVAPRVASVERGPTVQSRTLYTVALELPDPAGPSYYRLSGTSKARTPGGTYRYAPQLCSSDPLLRQSIVDVDLGNGAQVCFGNEGAVFSGETFDGQTRRLVVRLYVYRGPEMSAGTEVGLRLERLSDEAYRFERTRRLAELVGDNPFAEPLDLFSNLSSGIGVFAGATPVDVPVAVLD